MTTVGKADGDKVTGPLKMPGFFRSIKNYKEFVNRGELAKAAPLLERFIMSASLESASKARKTAAKENRWEVYSNSSIIQSLNDPDLKSKEIATMLLEFKAPKWGGSAVYALSKINSKKAQNILGLVKKSKSEEASKIITQFENCEKGEALAKLTRELASKQ